jgi:hypothetical protein
VWLAFVRMLTIFLHPKAKTFRLASFLREKRHLPLRKYIFVCLQESLQNKKYLP